MTEMRTRQICEDQKEDSLEPYVQPVGDAAHKTEGAFYVFPKFTHTKKSSLEITQALIDEALVVSTPGLAFGAAGEGHVRFSIAERTSDLEKMVDRLAKVVPNL